MGLKPSKNYYYEHGKWGGKKAILKIQKCNLMDKDTGLPLYTDVLVAAYVLSDFHAEVREKRKKEKKEV